MCVAGLQFVLMSDVTFAEALLLFLAPAPTELVLNFALFVQEKYLFFQALFVPVVVIGIISK